ncbi:hypothetical protein [Exiguobacterium sp. JLM-2]|uniref:hypothetical protein n=1 Tax=Exiguobacterium sp. JLM-2 TaxID=1647415 RepID=UPI0006495F1D|nr:hypothetical protein [Exiguobacterium sp. JLM-2]
MRIFLHDAEILRLTKQHDVNHDEIYSLGGVAGDLANIQRRALIDRDRGTIVEYWRTFYRDFLSGAVDIDADGLFQWEFDLQDYN